MKRKIGIVFAVIVLSVCLSFSFKAFAADDGSVHTDNDQSYSETADLQKKHINDGLSVNLEYAQAGYTGNSVCPKMNIYDNGVKLVEDVDYTLSYRNNVEIGKAYIEITGINNYFGKTVRPFVIVPGQVNGLRLADKSLTGIKLTWNRTAEADGYLVYRYENNKFVLQQTIAGGQNTQYSANLPSCSLYQYAVCAYKDIDGKRYYCEMSAPVSAYTLVDKYVSGITLRRADNSSNAQVLIHSVKGASGYQLMYSPDPNFKKYTATADSTLIAFNVSRYYTYLPIYVRVRAYLDTPDGRIYGAWSDSVNDFRYNGRARTNKPSNSGSMRVTFDKSVYGTGYEILYSYNSNFKSNAYKHISYGINDLDETISNLRRDKAYYVKVRPFYQLGSDYYYGPYGQVSSPEFIYVFATYSSKYVNNADRTTNLRLASQAINGTVIQPGETFDFNVVVGPRTAERGYKKATAFTGTHGTVQELGGGICQVASTLFNTCLYADVDITERHQHSQKVSYVPVGRDAAISGSYKNFRWTNNYDFPIKIYMNVSGGVITCTFYTQNSEDPGNIDLKVTRNGDKYTLKRYHNGQVDYTTTSKY